MFKGIKKTKAQIISEQAILLALVVAAITGISVYVQRGFMAAMKGAHDRSFADAKTAFYVSGSAGDFVDQYEPYYVNSTREIKQQTQDIDQLFPLATGQEYEGADTDTTSVISEGETAPPGEAD